MARVLIVDDDPLVRRLVGIHIEALGHQVLEASCGQDAISAVAEQPTDLVILDSMMPFGDGTSVLRHLRSNPETAHIAVIMLTLRNRAADKVMAFEDGADDYLTKPFDGSELAARVSRLLSRRPALENV